MRRVCMAENYSFSDDNLKRIQRNIADSYTYFRDNYDRFRFFKNYIYKQSVTDEQKSILRRLNRPDAEFNILEAYLSRLLGEFSKQEPGIIVSPKAGNPVPQDVLNLVEDHIRHVIDTADKDSFSYQTYKDSLSGGFSVAKVYPDYDSPMSFDYEVCVKKAYDSTMCGFDPMARLSHKGDGNYCFELFPMTTDDFKAQHPDIDISDITYQGMEGFNWTYDEAYDRKIIVVAEYFEKKKKNARIVKLSNGMTMTQTNYNKIAKEWENDPSIIEQLPVVVSKRTTEIQVICYYKLMQNKIIEYYETDYTYLPLVFFDGNSEFLTKGKSNSSYQMTRPYLYHAKGVQDLKNFAGQTLAHYLQNIVQHKFIVMKEAIPQEKDYLTALSDIQKMNTVVVNAFSENSPDKPIPTPIREVQNQPAPPEVMAAFQATDPTTQTILGSYASNLGQNDNDLSGKAVIESASVGNAASMPYVVGYLNGLTQVACIIADYMPKYLLGKRKIGVKDKAGNKDYKDTNGATYSPHSIKVNIEAGVNFQVQKNQALQQITSLMQASQEFSAFMNDDETLPILVDNLTIYGADRIKEAVPKWIQKKQQMQQQAMEMQQKNDPTQLMLQVEQQKAQLMAQIEQQKIQMQMLEIQMKKEQADIKAQLDIAKLAIEKELADAKVMEAEAKISQEQINSAVKLEESQTSLERHALDAAAKLAEIQSREHERNETV